MTMKLTLYVDMGHWSELAPEDIDNLAKVLKTLSGIEDLVITIEIARFEL